MNKEEIHKIISDIISASKQEEAEDKNFNKSFLFILEEVLNDKKTIKEAKKELSRRLKKDVED